MEFWWIGAIAGGLPVSARMSDVERGENGIPIDKP